MRVILTLTSGKSVPTIRAQNSSTVYRCPAWLSVGLIPGVTVGLANNNAGTNMHHNAPERERRHSIVEIQSAR